MTRIDWSVLSGPRVSRRTLMGVALASGAMGYARQLGSAAATLPSVPLTRRLSQAEPRQGGTLKLGFGISQIPNLDPAKVNPNGSGISLGHPIGATGALITVKALYELQRVQGKYALVTMCIGGGQGIAAVFERM